MDEAYETSLKLCRHCHTNMPSDASVCAACGRGQGRPILITLLVIIGALAFAVYIGGTNPRGVAYENCKRSLAATGYAAGVTADQCADAAVAAQKGNP